ncbi:MAG: DUF167 domain-containing protein [Candidatus Bathyarchaeota archaeon]|nr:DUF167 domain-containing protein [Candidatus Bathyarchaeota archaeon]
MKLIETKEGTLIEVFVKPNQPRFSVKLEGDEITVLCTEEPVKGKVNKELIKELSKLFHSDVEIVSGLTSRQKRLVVKNMHSAEAETILRSFLK